MSTCASRGGARAVPLVLTAAATPEAGSKVGQPGRARPSPARRRAYCRLLARGPWAFGTDVRHPAPAYSGSPTSPTWPTASSSKSTCRTTTGTSRPRPKSKGRPPSPASWTTSSTRSGRTTIRCEGRTLQIPADRHRHHKARVRVHPDPCRLPRTPRSLPGRRVPDRNPEGRVTHFDAIFRRPKWTAASRLTTSPQPPQRKWVHNPVSSKCS